MFTTSAGTPYRLAISAPTWACGPSTSWLTALPISCNIAPIFEIYTLAPSSEASMLAMRVASTA